MSAGRAAARGGSLTLALAAAATSGAGRSLRYGQLTAADRAAWQQEHATRVLRSFGVTLSAEGPRPPAGLLVSNHLSYLDALAYAALMPTTFVAKHEVRGWPVFGWLATMAGTIFVHREPRNKNQEAVVAMERSLAAGVTIVLFPEGTSTGGHGVLDFHSRFFEPAIRARMPVTAAAIAYRSQTAPEAQLAYYGADVFLPHLIRTVGQEGLEARVAFSRQRSYEDRKQAAHATHADVERLRAQLKKSTATRSVQPAPPSSRPQAAALSRTRPRQWLQRNQTKPATRTATTTR